MGILPIRFNWDQSFRDEVSAIYERPQTTGENTEQSCASRIRNFSLQLRDQGKSGMPTCPSECSFTKQRGSNFLLDHGKDVFNLLIRTGDIIAQSLEQEQNAQQSAYSLEKSINYRKVRTTSLVK